MTIKLICDKCQLDTKILYNLHCYDYIDKESKGSLEKSISPTLHKHLCSQCYNKLDVFINGELNPAYQK